MQDNEPMIAFLLPLAVFLATVFAASALGKVRSADRGLTAFTALRIPVRHPHTAAVSLIVLEAVMALGLLLTTGWLFVGFSSAALLLCTGLLIAVVRAHRLGSDDDCGCFGEWLPLRRRPSAHRAQRGPHRRHRPVDARRCTRRPRFVASRRHPGRRGLRDGCARRDRRRRLGPADRHRSLVHRAGVGHRGRRDRSDPPRSRCGTPPRHGGGRRCPRPRRARTTPPVRLSGMPRLRHSHRLARHGGRAAGTVRGRLCHPTAHGGHGGHGLVAQHPGICPLRAGHRGLTRQRARGRTGRPRRRSHRHERFPGRAARARQ
ncbi:hypothetical protein G4G29_05300 [Microbacterium sp. Se63.02b]|nr:hypothetical protein G4G29_05300 [Microbacterium sp. Se63.02b]